MLKVDAHLFYRLSRAITTTREQIDSWKDKEPIKDMPDEVVEKKLCQRFTTTMGKLCGLLRDLNAGVTLMAAERLRAEVACDEPKLKFSDYKAGLDQIDSRLQDELSLVSLFVIAPERKSFFEESAHPFGGDASERLSVAIPDIEDAGKCIALNQGTASVFHSMRVMEAALKGLAGLLGIPYAPSWESYIKQIEDKITAKHKTKGVQWKRDEPFYREILGNLQTIKIAWRNPTMHIVRRYTVEEAIEIYIAVRAFVKRLAPRLPMPKKPKNSSAGPPS